MDEYKVLFVPDGAFASTAAMYPKAIIIPNTVEARIRAEALREAQRQINIQVEGKNSPEKRPDFDWYMQGVMDAVKEVQEVIKYIISDKQEGKNG